MQAVAKHVLTGLVCMAVLQATGLLLAQDAARTESSVSPPPGAHRKPVRKKSFSKQDRSTVVAVALHTKRARHAGADCSHLVHAIYERAGFPYTYADSEDLYAGAQGFRRVEHPEPADLVVWHGHVGIVIRPAGHQFFSMLSTGPGVDNYRSRYWKGRGQPRFYRYVKTDS